MADLVERHPAVEFGLQRLSERFDFLADGQCPIRFERSIHRNSRKSWKRETKTYFVLESDILYHRSQVPVRQRTGPAAWGDLGVLLLGHKALTPSADGRLNHYTAAVLGPEFKQNVAREDSMVYVEQGGVEKRIMWWTVDGLVGCGVPRYGFPNRWSWQGADNEQPVLFFYVKPVLLRVPDYNEV